MNLKHFALGFFLTLWVGFITITFINYQDFFCVNIDLGTHASIVNYYAGAPAQDPAILCPNFIAEGRPINWWNNHITQPNYFTNIHKGIAMLSIWTGIPAAHLLNFIGIFSMWLCFGLSCAIAHKLCPELWTVNLALLILTPEHIWRFVTNGWITQNLITLVMLGLIYWVVKARRGRLMVILTACIALLLLAFIHNPIPIFLSLTNPLDAYRSLYTTQFFVVPGLFWLWKVTR